MEQKFTWTTFYGRQIKISELTHQHLSNILWYFELVLDMGNLYPIQKELNTRFGSIRLPYHPNLAFKEEVKALVDKKYTTGELNADIVVNGKWIGSLKY